MSVNEKDRFEETDRSFLDLFSTMFLSIHPLSQEDFFSDPKKENLDDPSLYWGNTILFCMPIRRVPIYERNSPISNGASHDSSKLSRH